MTDAMQRFLTLIAGNEGRKLDINPSDRGNWTGGAIGKGRLVGSKCGISAAAYPTLDIANLTDDAIALIYRRDYLDRICFDFLPLQIALLIADCAVNQGVGAAARILQASVGVAVDGVIGPQTLAAVRRQGNQIDLLAVEITARRGLAYASTDGLPVFGLGWFRRLVRTYLAAAAAAT